MFKKWLDEVDAVVCGAVECGVLDIVCQDDKYLVSLFEQEIPPLEAAAWLIEEYVE